jgi:bacterioferritin
MQVLPSAGFCGPPEICSSGDCGFPAAGSAGCRPPDGTDTHKSAGVDTHLSVRSCDGEQVGTQGRKIVGTDVTELLKSLNKAFSDEWLAYYQYWIGSKVVRGPNKEAVIAELTLHATEELAHATLLTTRIIQLGGVPVTKPQDWYKLTNCGYEAPDDPFIVRVLEQNIKGEQCAIRTYNALMKKTRDKDPVTYNMLLTILSQEVEHEEDLQALLGDVRIIMENR